MYVAFSLSSVHNTTHFVQTADVDKWVNTSVFALKRVQERIGRMREEASKPSNIDESIIGQLNVFLESVGENRVVVAEVQEVEVQQESALVLLKRLFNGRPLSETYLMALALETAVSLINNADATVTVDKAAESAIEL